MAVIKAHPFDFPCDNKHLALIVIDMQRDFVEEGGFGASLGNDVSRLRAIIPTVARLIDGFRAAGLPVVHTRECHRPDLSDLPVSKRDRGAPSLRIGDPGPMGRLLVAGEPGAEIIPELSPIGDEVVIDKPGKGAFYATDLQDILKARDVRQLVFAGVTTEVCVQTTMREANDRGYDGILATDATESYFAAFRDATIAMITAQGGIVGCAAETDHILEALNG
nr:isochorismatase family cysteine hydrolase [Marinicella sp. W31]MDC2876195.1 cysteine hydrolase [Marinicella sp. W31]